MFSSNLTIGRSECIIGIHLKEDEINSLQGDVENPDQYSFKVFVLQE